MWTVRTINNEYITILTNTEWRNIITHAYIHNDSTVEVTRCGKLIASFRELDWGRFEIRKSQCHIYWSVLRGN